MLVILIIIRTILYINTKFSLEAMFDDCLHEHINLLEEFPIKSFN